MIIEKVSVLSNMDQYRRGLRYLENELEDKNKVDVLLKKDTSYIKDRNSILVMIETDLRLEPLGYITNIEKDIEPGHAMALDLIDWVSKNTKIGEEGYRYPVAKAYKIDRKNKEYRIYIDIDMEEIDKDRQSRLVSMDIDLMKFPRIDIMIKDFYKGIDGLLEIRRAEDKIIAGYKGMNIGNINSEDLKEKYLERLKEDIIYGKIQDVKKEEILLDLDLSDILVIERPDEEEILNIIKDKVDKNIVTMEEALERKRYLEEYDVSPIAIKRLFQSYYKYPDNIMTRIPEPKILYIDNTGIIRRTVSYINAGKNLLFEGERGTGKNVLTETLAWLYNRPLYEFPLNSQHSNSSIFGSQTFETDNRFKELEEKIIKKSKSEDIEDMKEIIEDLERLNNLGDNKRLVFNKSSIIQAFECGGVIVLDEFNTALAHVMTALNGLLDHRRRLYVPNYGNVEGHKNFIAIATQNKGYQGTFSINEGTMDRFVPIIFPNTVDIKSIIKINVDRVDRQTLNICQRLYDGIKNAVLVGELEENALSVRGFIDACMVLDQGIELKTALEDNIANRAVDLDDRAAIKEMIKLQLG